MLSGQQAHLKMLLKVPFGCLEAAVSTCRKHQLYMFRPALASLIQLQMLSTIEVTTTACTVDNYIRVLSVLSCPDQQSLTGRLA